VGNAFQSYYNNVSAQKLLTRALQYCNGRTNPTIKEATQLKI
jgi:hypothetical protein